MCEGVCVCVSVEEVIYTFLADLKVASASIEELVVTTLVSLQRAKERDNHNTLYCWKTLVQNLS